MSILSFGWLWFCCFHLWPPSPAMLCAEESPSPCFQVPPIHHSLTRCNFCPQLVLNRSLTCLLDRFFDQHLWPFTPTTPQAWDGHTTNTWAPAPLSSIKIIIKSPHNALRKSLLWTTPVLSSFLICQMLLFHHFLFCSPFSCLLCHFPLPLLQCKAFYHRTHLFSLTIQYSVW